MKRELLELIRMQEADITPLFPSVCGTCQLWGQGSCKKHQPKPRKKENRRG
jgi:hypothetical protein